MHLLISSRAVVERKIKSQHSRIAARAAGSKLSLATSSQKLSGPLVRPYDSNSRLDVGSHKRQITRKEEVSRPIYVGISTCGFGGTQAGEQIRRITIGSTRCERHAHRWRI